MGRGEARSSSQPTRALSEALEKSSGTFLFAQLDQRFDLVRNEPERAGFDDPRTLEVIDEWPECLVRVLRPFK